MKCIRKKLQEARGNAEILSVVFVLFILVVIVSASMSVFGQVSKINDLAQIAQTMAREISLTGEINDVVISKLDSLEQTMRLDVDMTVEGQFIGNSKKLKTESDFTVVITYISSYHIGFIDFERKDTPYVKKAHGTVEEYHK